MLLQVLIKPQETKSWSKEKQRLLLLYTISYQQLLNKDDQKRANYITSGNVSSN